MTLKDDLIAAVEAGTVLDLAGPGRPDRAEMDGWGSERTIEASVIRDVLLGRATPKADPHGVRLRGLRISGSLDLYNVRSDLDLRLSNCLIEDGVILRHARLRMVGFADCVLSSGNAGTCLDGQQLAAGALYLANSTFNASDADSAIDLRRAQIRGSLNLSGAQLNGHDPDGDSLIGDGLTVDGNMFARTSGTSAFTATGAIRMPGAHIGGQLSLSGVRLNGHDTNGNSLIGDGLTVDGDMFLGADSESAFVTVGAIRLARAHIHGQLGFSTVQLGGHDTHGNSLIGDGLTVDGDLILGTGSESALTAAGAIRLQAAHVHGQLALTAVRVNGHDANSNSLIGDGLTVDGDMFLGIGGQSSFTTTGAIRLPGAHIHGQLDLSAVQLNGHDNDGDSLIGHGLTVDGDMFLGTGNGSAFSTAGAIRLQGAHVHGQLALSAVQLKGHDTNGNSLIGDGLNVDGDVLLGTGGQSSFTTTGAIRLPGAHIHGQLGFFAVQLKGHDTNGNSLIGFGLNVDGDMFLGTGGQSSFTTTGAIRLPRSHILGQLSIPLSSLGNARAAARISLAGASIGELALDLAEPVDPDVHVDLQDATYAGLSRLDNLDQWLNLLSRHTVTYTPQAYQQLATVHRAAGHERDARRILIAQQDDRRRRVVRPGEGARRRTRFRFWARRTGLWFQKITIGYGYRTWPAFVGVLVLAAIGAGLGIAAGHTHAGTTKQFAAYRPASELRKVDQNCSTVEQAALGVRVPFLSNLGAGDCVLNTTSVAGEIYSAAIWTDQVLAWAAATLAVAGYTGLVRRT